MTTTTVRLADGRTLTYYDERPHNDHTTNDSRSLPTGISSSELRLDPLTDEWVIVAAHRNGRTHLPTSSACPLCPTTSTNATEIPASDYDVVVFDNRFPSVLPAPEPASSDGAHQLSARRPGNGRCEVVCFSADHHAGFADLPRHRVRTIIDAWADRTRILGQLAGVQQVFIFENRGEEIGVTLHHPHGQIYAYPFVTPRTERNLATARRHAHRTGRNLFADVLAAEQHTGERIVRRSRYWTAFVPSAARWPVEVNLYPNRRALDLADLSDPERDDLADIYPDLLDRLDALHHVPMPYIAAWHQAPVHHGHDVAYLHLQLISTRRSPTKLKYLAGSESAMGVFINDTIPEQVAHDLRGADRHSGG